MKKQKYRYTKIKDEKCDGDIKKNAGTDGCKFQERDKKCDKMKPKRGKFNYVGNVDSSLCTASCRITKPVEAIAMNNLGNFMICGKR